MFWNKTDIYGKSIMLLGSIATGPNARNYQAGETNKGDIEKAILALQQYMIDYQIDAINVSWSGTQLMSNMTPVIKDNDATKSSTRRVVIDIPEDPDGEPN